MRDPLGRSAIRALAFECPERQLFSPPLLSSSRRRSQRTPARRHPLQRSASWLLSSSLQTPMLRTPGAGAYYQMILSANCISLAVVVVEVNKPVIPVGAPVESKMSVLSGVTGTAKFAWVKMLKISARKCTMNDSDIRLTGLFLTTEKSRFIVPGPVKIFRPALPRRLKHCGYGTVTGLPSEPVNGCGSQLAVQKSIFGADGMAKHWVLT